MIPLSPSGVARNVKRRLTKRLPAEDRALYSGYDAALLARRPFLNIGAGDFYHPYWTNVDFASDWYRHATAFVQYDLTAKAPLPFESGAVEAVYTSHTIEHVSDEAVQNLFDEARRVLRPGGTLRVTCPDASLLVRSVTLGKNDYWRWRHRWFEGPLSSAPSVEDVTLEDFLVREIATPKSRFYINRLGALEPDVVRQHLDKLQESDLLDWLVSGLHFRPEFSGDHINWWTETKVIEKMRQAGFEVIWPSRRGQSLFGPLTNPRLFDNTKPPNSLFVEAVR